MRIYIVFMLSLLVISSCASRKDMLLTDEEKAVSKLDKAKADFAEKQRERRENDKLKRQEDMQKQQEKKIAYEEAKKRSEESRRQEIIAQMERDKQHRIDQENKFKELVGAETLNKCSNNIFTIQTLLSENPYDIEGKCYLLYSPGAVDIQLLNRTTALFIFPSKTINVDFIDVSAPVSGQSRIFIIMGNKNPYKYNSASGVTMTASSLRLLKEIINK